jgi:hypothetical protein
VKEGKSVHKDFHGALSFSMSYLRDRFGGEELREFFREASREVYQPLIERIRSGGLGVLADHLKGVYVAEDGEFELNLHSDELVLEMRNCVAILHMRKVGYPIDPGFCDMSTKLVSEAIVSAAGFESAIDYDQERGRCSQRFYKKAR